MSDATIRTIDSSEALTQLLARSAEKPLWLFKHSRICPASSEALREFRKFAESSGWSALFALIVVQQSRALSEEVARRTGVRHASPQVLLLHDGKCRWHASHWEITLGALSEAARDESTRSLTTSGSEW